MKNEKRIALVFGLSVLLMIVPVGIFAGQWMVDKIFTDDFDRADVINTQNLGPGWLANHCACGIFNRSTISGGKLAAGTAPAPVLYATNFMVGLYYLVEVDVQYYDLTISNPFADSGNMLFGNRDYGPLPDNAAAGTNLWMDFLAPYQAGPPQNGRIFMRILPTGTEFANTYPTNFVTNAWYHMTLQRSNNLARFTVIGSNINVDSGWKDLGAGAPPLTLRTAMGDCH